MDFDGGWVTAGLDEETLNLIADSEDLIFTNTSSELDRGYYKSHEGIVKVLDLEPLSDLLDQTKSVARRVNYKPTKSDFEQTPKGIGAFAGDDEIEVNTNGTFQCILLALYPIMGMKISWDDTSINPLYGDYTEDLIMIPGTFQNTYQTTSLSGRQEDMSYMDIPKLRLLIPVSPMRPDHSGTIDGKASMMGARLNWTPRKSPCRMLMELANICQDVMLGTVRAKKPAYMPAKLGGLGKPIPFNNPRNWVNYFLAWKGGERYEFSCYVINMFGDWTRSLDSVEMVAPPALLRNLVRFNTQYHDWIKGRSIYAPQFWLDRPDWASEYIVGYYGLSREFDSAASRAIRGGFLVSEETLLVHLEHAKQCEALLSQKTWEEFLLEKESIVSEWKHLSSYGQASLGQIEEISPDYTLHPHKLDESMLRHTFEFLKRRDKDIKQLLSTSPVYRVEVIDALYDKSVMRIKTELHPRAGNSTMLVEYDVSNARNITRSRDLISWVLKKPEERGEIPTELVDDDEVIISKVKPLTIYVIVTDDIALCRRVNKRTGEPVIRVPVAWHYTDIYSDQATWSCPWMEIIQNIYPDKAIEQIEDSGSIEAYEEKCTDEGTMYTEPVSAPIRFHADPRKGEPISRKRLPKVTLNTYKVGGFPKGYTFDYRNEIGLRTATRRPRTLG